MSSNVVFLTGRNEYDLENSLATNPWPLLQNAHRQQRIMQVEIRGIEDKGYIIWVGTIKGFISFNETGLASENELYSLLGSKVPVLILDLNRPKELPIFSIIKAKNRLGKETRKTQRVSETRVGIVQRMTQSKAIVDIGGVDTLLAKDDIAWQFVRVPREVLKLGQEVKVRVTRNDEDEYMYQRKY